jgi:hypothetical protein
MALNVQEELSSEMMFCIYRADYPNMMMSLAQMTPLMRNGMKHHRIQHTACTHDSSCQFHPSPLFGHPPLLSPTSFPFGHPPILSGPQIRLATSLATRLARLARLALICIHNVVECTCPPICPNRPIAKRTYSPIRSMGG